MKIESEVKVSKPRTLMFSIKGLNNKLKRILDANPIQIGDKLITGMQCGVLGYLSFHSDKRDIFQKDIEDEFQIRRSTATGILQLMEKNHLIERIAVDYDARLKKIVVTTEGVETRNKVDQRIQTVEAKLTQNLTKEEVETLYALIDKISDGI
jgi:DNA-binding MarR family transcriptional regulator